MTPERAFGRILQEERKKQKLSQERLATLCGLDRTFISMLERGRRQPSLTTVLNLADTLGISAADLVGRVETELHSASSVE